MAKLKDDPITAQDMADFVRSNSDFDFEMQVLAKLTSLGFICSHSGTYRDPVTHKIRQFDIRARYTRGECQILMAVECKNLHANFPLLISAVPRTKDEAFHDQIGFNAQQVYTPVSVRQIVSFYAAGDMVGKQYSQIGRDNSGVLVGNDDAVFEKFTQAVNSCHDLVGDAVRQRDAASSSRVILPMLVLPDGTLWQTDYDACGGSLSPPRQVMHSSVFLNYAWLAHTGLFDQSISYRLSHMEFVTFGAIAKAVQNYLGPNGFFPH
jgi:hypothetical protein